MSNEMSNEMSNGMSNGMSNERTRTKAAADDSSMSLNSILILLVFRTRNLLREYAKHLMNTTIAIKFTNLARLKQIKNNFRVAAKSERGDVPGWVLVVLMTTGLVTGIWTVAQPRLSSILKNSLDNMNSIR
jgi:hypothetical protein